MQKECPDAGSTENRRMREVHLQLDSQPDSKPEIHNETECFEIDVLGMDKADQVE